MMVGDDDTLPVAKAEAYLAYARAAGHPAPIELLSYADAKHGWTDPGLGAAREYPYLASTRKCPFALITPNRGLELLVDGQERPFDDGSWAACIRGSLGYVMGYDEKIRRQSTDAAIAFLKRNLLPKAPPQLTGRRLDQSTTIWIRRSVSRRSAVSAKAARNISAVASSGAVTRTSTPEAQARTVAGPMRSIANTASETGSGVCVALRSAKRCCCSIPRKRSKLG
jgi:hypothetical protein